MPMRLQSALPLTLLALAIFWSANRVEAESLDWKLISDSKDTQVFSREVPGTRLVAFKGIGIVHAPIAKVANVLLDEKRAREWVYLLREMQILKRISEREFIIYTWSSSPFFMVKDRDFVTHAKLDVDPVTHSVTLRCQSTESDAAPPVAGRVRADVVESSFKLVQVDNGESTGGTTQVTVELLADPKGAIPKWMVNWAQRSWPVKSMERLRTQAAKPDVAENAFVKSVLQGHTRVLDPES